MAHQGPSVLDTQNTWTDYHSDLGKEAEKQYILNKFYVQAKNNRF